LNSQNVTVNTTVASGYNGMSAGTITLANGIAVTVANGSRWVVV